MDCRVADIQIITPVGSVDVVGCVCGGGGVGVGAVVSGWVERLVCGGGGDDGRC